jgi:hypothetical protein
MAVNRRPASSSDNCSNFSRAHSRLSFNKPVSSSRATLLVGLPRIGLCSNGILLAAPTEEEHIRSRMVSAYEDYKSSTSDDEEMDPPPPPRNLQLDSAPDKVPSTESQLADRKMSSTGQPQSKMSAASDCSAAGQLVKSEISDQKQSQYQKESVTLDYQQHQQQAAILREMKLTYASSSSSSSASSPALAAAVQQQQFFEQQISNAVESRKLSNKPNMDETTTMSMELKPNAQRSGNANNPFSDLYDNQLDTKVSLG